MQHNMQDTSSKAKGVGVTAVSSCVRLRECTASVATAGSRGWGESKAGGRETGMREFACFRRRAGQLALDSGPS